MKSDLQCLAAYILFEQVTISKPLCSRVLYLLYSFNGEWWSPNSLPAVIWHHLLIDLFDVISENHWHLFMMMFKMVLHVILCCMNMNTDPLIESCSWLSSWNFSNHIFMQKFNIITVFALTINNIWLSCLHFLQKRLIAIIFPFSCNT